MLLPTQVHWGLTHYFASLKETGFPPDEPTSHLLHYWKVSNTAASSGPFEILKLALFPEFSNGGRSICS